MGNSASKIESRDPLDTIPDSDPNPAANSEANPVISAVPIDEAELGIEVDLDFGEDDDEPLTPPVIREQTGVQRRVSANLADVIVSRAGKWTPKIVDKHETPLNEIVRHYRKTLYEHFKTNYFFIAWEISRAKGGASLQYPRLTDLEKIKCDAKKCAESLRADTFKQLIPAELVDELVAELEDADWNTRTGVEKMSDGIRYILGLPEPKLP